MAIPPFPAQDLAKLVLGYLVEEQLMTAYDEFLHTSPFLDAQKNEYDRIFMHSLRKILAEYRAVRIHVESCKPIALRKKLLQCNNLLEIVTFLVRHIDVNKLQKDASSERISFDSQDVSTSKIGCDACNSLRLGSCVCSHTKRNVSSSKSCNNRESIDMGESLAQATSLSDLPGNKEPSDNKHIRILEPQLSHSTSIAGPSHEVLTACSNISKASIEQSSIVGNHHVQSHPYNSMSLSAAQKSSALANATSMECSQNIAEFNTVLKQVYNNSIVTGSMRDNSNIVCADSNNTNRMSIAGTFQDFSTGVGGVAKPNINVPDSSTSENMHVQAPHIENDITQFHKRNLQTGQTKKCVFRVGNVKHDVTEISSEIIDVETVNAPPTSKPDEQKVTIISDVKVGNDKRLVSLAPTAKNATSTPLLQTQTIFINGTPVYNPKPREQSYTFTRDEIMAMPTIILVPASGPLKSVSSVSTQPQAIAQSSSTTPSISTLAPSFPPLSVDVSNSLTNANNNLPNVRNATALGDQTAVSKSDLIKTVEAFKNATEPKDSIVASSSSTSTPQMFPPKRRSSSTPRRTSHVRVLDFTTPRRLLNETIAEDPNQEGAGNNSNEVFISKSPNVSFPQGTILDSTKNSETIIEATVTDNIIAHLREENNKDPTKPVIRKDKDWDADLRALATASASVDKRIPASKPKAKSKNTKKAVEQKNPEKKTNDTTPVGKTKKKSNVKSNITPNVRTSKKKGKQADGKNIATDIPCPNLPTSVDTSAKENPLTNSKEPDKLQNKSNDEDRIDTPEVERLSLHHEIGVKLNISDLLETPYKQALYDIQIETPRFLGHDLPDDPMSDIKIMDIPTPRFLSNSNMPYTPKPAQITPSSYSSRPTDYSSGGSYYKPDDQDYMRIMDDIGCPVTSTLLKDNTKSGSVETSHLKESQPKEKTKKSRYSRPIRQCTKNVSYYNSPASNKTNDADKKDDVSSCSDTISANSSFDNAVKDVATLRSDKTKRAIKGGNNKSPRSIKKPSPLKKASQKSFMKIKPRRPTPTKDAVRKINRKIPETTQNSIKRKSRNRSTSKDKGTSATSLAVPAPTKSRRKSSTPRKLHSTKTLNSESSGHESSEVEAPQTTQIEIQNSSVSCIHDSDTEQLRLRWSDDGSQDTRLSANEADEISQIKDYINKTIPASPSNKENDGSLQNDLIKRGFDVETAKIIERDLLHTPANENETEKVIFLEPSTEESKINKILERSVESDTSTLASNLVIHEENDSEYIELSVHECYEESANYLVVQHDDTKSPPKNDLPKLKDKFSMEVFIDDGVVVRLRATAFNYFPDANNQDLKLSAETNRETEIAVSSISNIDRLYSPFKDSIRAQCLDIFNSTLTSIDTPLKTDSPKRNQDCAITEIDLEEEIVEKVEIKEKTEKRKRKRSHCSSASEESVNDHKVVKKVKPETQYILNSKEIKNLDIETVLSRLHGP